MLGRIDAVVGGQGCLGFGVVGAEDLERAGVARGAGVREHDVVDGRMAGAEAAEADFEDHFFWWVLGEGVGGEEDEGERVARKLRELD